MSAPQTLQKHGGGNVKVNAARAFAYQFARRRIRQGSAAESHDCRLAGQRLAYGLELVRTEDGGALAREDVRNGSARGDHELVRVDERPA